jgi:glutaredoxin-related protein
MENFIKIDSLSDVTNFVVIPVLGWVLAQVRSWKKTKNSLTLCLAKSQLLEVLRELRDKEELDCLKWETARELFVAYKNAGGTGIIEDLYDSVKSKYTSI